MPSWDEILNDVNADPKRLDSIRRSYLKAVSDITGRNTIAYYSGFLQKQNIQQSTINDNDKNGFMATIHKLDRSKGLDLVLHTEGGGIAAAESLVEYLKQMFGNNIRAIVPQLAMSAGTMIACSCKSIVMGKQSNLGPIDPQFNGVSAWGIVEEFKKAREEIASYPERIPLWQAIIGQYKPTLIGECQKAIDWSADMVCKWLTNNMFSGNTDAEEYAKKVVLYLSNHEDRKTHERHIGIDECEQIGLKIERLETLQQEDNFQDAVLSMHHAFMLTFSSTGAFKIIENQNSVAMISHLPNQNIPLAQVFNPAQFKLPVNIPQAPGATT